MTTPTNAVPPTGKKFERRIQNEERERAAEAERLRVNRQAKLRHEVGPVLPPDGDDITTAPAEASSQPTVLRGRSKQSLERHELPTQPRSPTRPQGPLTPPTSDFESPSSSDRAQIEQSQLLLQSRASNPAMLALRAELNEQRSQIKDLRRELQRAKQDVEGLQAERDGAWQRSKEAALTAAHETSVGQEAAVERLTQMLNNAWDERRRLETEIQCGRDREAELERRLESARTQNRKENDDAVNVGKELSEHQALREDVGVSVASSAGKMRERRPQSGDTREVRRLPNGAVFYRRK